METLFTLFGAPVTAYGVNAACALALTLLLSGVFAARKKADYGSIIRLAAVAIPLCWLFSRLFYVLANCTYYLTTLSNPSLALRFFDGGYALSGALAGLILAAGLTEKWRKLPRGVLLDAVGLGMLPGIAVERLGEAGTGMGLGRAIYTPWLAKLPLFAATDETGEIVHAVYRYEALAAALIFVGVMIYLIFRGKEALRGGDVLLMVLTLLGCAQVLLESLRNDGHMVVHFVRINQVLAMALPVIALAIWSRRGKKPLVSWLVVVAAIALATRQEFRIDSSENLWLDYGIMALCLALVAVTTLRRRSGRPLL